MTKTGTSIRNTFARVRDVLRDVRTLLGALDEELSQKGWFPTNNDREPTLTVDGGATFYRAYTQGPERKAPRGEFRGVEVHLLPEFADEALLLLFEAKLVEPLAPKELWDRWDDIGDALGQRLPKGECATFRQDDATAIKGAAHIVVQALPLADIANRRAVGEVLVPQLLGLRAAPPPTTEHEASPPAAK